MMMTFSTATAKFEHIEEDQSDFGKLAAKYNGQRLIRIITSEHTAKPTMTAKPVIRPAQVEDAPAITRVHVDTWRTAYIGIVPDDYLANLSYDRSLAGWVDHLSNPQGERTFVAETPSGQIVALASGGPIREALAGYDGELYVLYVLKPFQRMGTGKLLVTQAARDLADQGYHSLIIWVLKNNPACRFYERLGGRLVAEKVVEIGGKQLIDVAYVWPDLAVFSQGGFP